MGIASDVTMETPSYRKVSDPPALTNMQKYKEKLPGGLSPIQSTSGN